MNKFNSSCIGRLGSFLSWKNVDLKLLCALGILMIHFASVADAGCSCSAIGNWEATAQQFLNSNDTGGQPSNPGSVQAKANATPVSAKPVATSGFFPNGKILKPIMRVSSSDLVVDVSNGSSYAKSHAKGAINIPSSSFLESNGSLKAAGDLAKVLGSAGISSALST